MMRISKAHIAGVAVAPAEDDALLESAIAAGTRALLDAGVTYSNIDQSFACFQDGLRIPRQCFETFGMEGAPCHEISNSTGLFTAVQYIQSRQANCVLVLGLDADVSASDKAKTAVIGIVLVSDLFLTSHAYLKDSAICISGFSLASQVYLRSLGGPDASRSFKAAASDALRQAKLNPADIQLLHLPKALREGNPRALGGFDAAASELSRPLASQSGTVGLLMLCTLVWQFRGWASGLPLRAQNCLLYTSGPYDIASVLILNRSDGRAALAWEEVRDVRDGRERLGYNPAVETKDVCVEDLRAVRARPDFVPDEQVQRQLPAKGGDRAALARL